MRRAATAAIILIAMVLGARTPALAQTPPPPPNNPVPTAVATRGTAITPLGGFGLGAIFSAAAAPIIGTIVLGREMTPNEVYRSTLISFLGPVGWWLGATYFSDTVGGQTPPTRNPPSSGARQARGRNISIPRRGETGFVPNHLLIEFDAGTSPQYIAALARRLQITLLETQTFALTGRTVQLWQNDGTRSARNTLLLLSGYGQVSAGQGNHYYHGMQAQPPATQNAAPAADPAQYVVPKLHLLEAHRISNGDDGVFAGEFDALGTSGPAHAHGTGMGSSRISQPRQF